MPQILPPVVHSPSASPLTAVRDAIAWARRLGLHVRPSVPFHGVECTSSLSDLPWVLATEVGNVDPIGAAILRSQSVLTDLDQAAMDVLGGSAPYAECFACALRGEDIPIGWKLGSAYLVALAGWSDGSTIREELLGGLRVVGHEDNEPVTGKYPAWTPDFEAAAVRAGYQAPKAVK